MVLPGRVAPAARRRRLQPQPLPPVDRVDPATASRRRCAPSAGSPSPSSPSSASACSSSAATASPTLALVNNYLGPADAPRRALALLVHRGPRPAHRCSPPLLLAIGPVRRLERRFAVPVPARSCSPARWCSATTGWSIDGLGNLRFRTHGVAWFFVLGWLAHRSTTFAGEAAHDRCSACSPSRGSSAAPSGSGSSPSASSCSSGAATCRCRAPPIRPIAAVAAASMWIYVSHFRIWPPLDRNLPHGVAYALDRPRRHRDLAARRVAPHRRAPRRRQRLPGAGTVGGTQRLRPAEGRTAARSRAPRAGRPKAVTANRWSSRERSLLG